MASNEQERVSSAGSRPKPDHRNVYFCSGKFCPGYHWPASNVAHPTSCAVERLNSADNLRDAAERRRALGRDVRFDVPPSSEELSNG